MPVNALPKREIVKPESQGRIRKPSRKLQPDSEKLDSDTTVNFRPGDQLNQKEGFSASAVYCVRFEFAYSCSVGLGLVCFDVLLHLAHKKRKPHVIIPPPSPTHPPAELLNRSLFFVVSESWFSETVLSESDLFSNRWVG